MYKFIFYRLYKLAILAENSWSVNIRMPQYVAFFSISILQSFNLLTLYIIFVHGIELINVARLNPILGVIFMSLIYVVNYFLFLKKKKYLNIEKSFDKSSSKNKEVKSFLFWFYILFSFTALYIALETLVK